MSGKVQELQKPAEVAAAPDTSLVPVDSGYLALTSNALDIIRASVVTKITLEKATSNSDPETYQKLCDFIDYFRGVLV